MGLTVEVRKVVPGFTLDVSFRTKNELAVLFGYSGSGKSMTLRAIAGLLTPDCGRIAFARETLFDSASGRDLPPQERRFGYVGQEVALFPHLDVAGNIAYGLKGAGRRERRDRVDELLEALRLDGLSRRRPAELSGGQRQRVALARALAPRPRALLLDEPFSALDLPLRLELWELIGKIRQEVGVPVLMVTHDPFEARSMADRIIVYRYGRVVRAWAPREVLTRPDCPEVDTLVTGWTSGGGEAAAGGRPARLVSWDQAAGGG